MKKKSLRFMLTTYSSALILGSIVIFSVISLVYLVYISEIISKIYSMDDDFLSPILNVLLILFGLLLIFALCASIVSSLSISNRFLKTIKDFIKDIRHIKEEGVEHRLIVEGNDELATLGKEFNMLMDQVEETMQKQNQFISDASHELKTPLAILKGNIEMLQRWGKDDPAILDNALEVSSGEVNRLIVLCEELLHLTREVTIDCEEIEISTSVERVCEEMKLLHPSFNVNMELDHSKVAIKEEHIQQLCIIFIDNAIKYAKENSKKMVITLDEGVLTFKDYGIGIQEEHKQRIFDRFYKIEESREQQNNSFGLGLAIAKRIADQYGFVITLESEYQEYTQFSIDMQINKKEEQT